MTRPAKARGDEPLSLQEAADLLGVHYMTAYRYVRTGRLVATRDGTSWVVPRSSIAALAEPKPAGRTKRGAPRPRRDYADELVALLIDGDEAQAWRLVQDALSSAYTNEQLYLEMLGPAMHDVGDAWEAGRISIAEEHRATAVAYRLIGRLGPTFARRGPTRGFIVLGAPAGDRHGLATSLLADPLRGHGFTVADLGADTPAASFAEVVAGGERTRAVGIVASVPVGDRVLAGTVDAIHSIGDIAVLLGGHAIKGAAHATKLGADGYSGSAADAVAWFTSR